MWYQLARHTTEANTLLTMRMTFGDEATADYLFENFNATTEESVAFGQRHSNQMSSLLKAKYKPDEKS